MHTDMGKTVFHAPATRFEQPAGDSFKNACCLIIKESDMPVRSFQIVAENGQRISMGRNAQSGLVLNSPVVSREHGFLLFDSGRWYLYEYCSVVNHVRINGAYSERKINSGVDCYVTELHDYDILRIDYSKGAHRDGLQIVFSLANEALRINPFSLSEKSRVTIGRDESCDICLPHVNVSRLHATLERHGTGFTIQDNHSTNGILVNNEPLLEKRMLHERDIITIVWTRLIFSADSLYVITGNRGVSLSAVNLTKEVGFGKKKKRLLDGVNLRIQPGEFVAIVGSSGSGKSTLLNCLSGFMKPTNGQIYFNCEKLSACFDAIKSSIGFVPQQDIVFDSLSLRRMLEYAARQRMPADTSPFERRERVQQVLETLELSEHAETRIQNLSGGQRKRCSIAVELLADPGLFLLDEPTSGLDPGTERSLMRALHALSKKGKTIIMVTHTPLYLEFCDKIVVLGQGGTLCSCLSISENLAYFGADSVVDIYDIVSQNTRFWAEKWAQRRHGEVDSATDPGRRRKSGISAIRQFAIITQRYAEIMLCNRGRLFALIVQCPLIAIVIALVCDQGLYQEYGATKTILFTLTVAAVWIGMLNAVPEICKERAILRRELMAGLSKVAYVASKLLVLSIIYALQAILLVCVFSICAKMPSSSILIPPLPEIILTLFFIMFASGCMGLAISSLVSSIDMANSMVPYFMVPQMVLSGILFDLGSNFLRFLKYPILTYWGVNALCASADVCALPMPEIATSFGSEIPKTPVITEFAATAASLITSWGGLALIFCVSLAICAGGVHTIGKRLR